MLVTNSFRTAPTSGEKYYLEIDWVWIGVLVGKGLKKEPDYVNIYNFVMVSPQLPCTTLLCCVIERAGRTRPMFRTRTMELVERILLYGRATVLVSAL